MKTLLLFSNYTDQMSYYNDWVDAFKEHPDFNTLCVNVFNGSKDFVLDVKKKIQTYDVIVLHHSMNGDTLNYLKPYVTALQNRRGKLISFVGNEVNLPTVKIADKINCLQQIEADFIATQLLEEAGQWLYKDCKKSKVISVPHALNSKAFISQHNFIDRKIDIGTRSARYGVYIGDNDRNNIINYFHNKSSLFNLKVDLGLSSSQKRFNRQEWAYFLSSCKATLSTEAGSFYLEPDDKLIKTIHQYLKSKSSKFVLPNETFLRKTYRATVPLFLREMISKALKNKIIESDSVDQDVDFQEIYNKFFANAQKAPVYTKAISSRHFDAIGTKTLHIMYPGRYNDILTPGEHYFELKRDHSNVEDLLALLSDAKKVNNVTEAAYNHVMHKHKHKHRLDKLLSYINEST